MEVAVVITPNFKREAKKLTKKYRSLKGELEVLIKEIKKEPTIGIKIVENTFKIRLAVKSKGKGKSGGLRIITYLYLKIEDEITKVYLLSIYDKSDTENISEKLLKQLTHGVQQTIAEENAFDLSQNTALEQNEEHSKDNEIK